MSHLICHDCRKGFRCRKRWQVAHETVLSLVDDRVVECDDYLPTWQAQLAA